jgi:predicted  nucleic acid-binding Zn-ribbon protein
MKNHELEQLVIQLKTEVETLRQRLDSHLIRMNDVTVSVEGTANTHRVQENLASLRDELWHLQNKNKRERTLDDHFRIAALEVEIGSILLEIDGTL